MKAIILIKVATGNIEEVFYFLKKLRAVDEAYMTFGPFDLVAIIHAEELSEIGRLVACDIQPIPGVLQTLTCIATEAWHADSPELAYPRMFSRKGSRAVLPYE